MSLGRPCSRSQKSDVAVLGSHAYWTSPNSNSLALVDVAAFASPPPSLPPLSPLQCGPGTSIGPEHRIETVDTHKFMFGSETVDAITVPLPPGLKPKGATAVVTYTFN